MKCECRKEWLTHYVTHGQDGSDHEYDKCSQCGKEFHKEDIIEHRKVDQSILDSMACVSKNILLNEDFKDC